MRIELTTIYVDDQEQALHFYTDILGLEKKADYTHDGYRWLTVASGDASNGVELQLAAADAHPAGKAFQEALFAQGERAIMFYVDDVQKEADRLAAAGVEFTQPTTKAIGSTIAVFKDTVGNLVQITTLDRWK